MTQPRVSFPLVQGTYSRQAHVAVPYGTFEREHARDGFAGPVSHLYHKHAPTSWSSWVGQHRPRLLDLNELQSTADSPWSIPPVVFNSRGSVRFWKLPTSMKTLARNADGDTLLLLHRGSGHLFCDYGHLEIREGDFLMIPRGTIWRIETEAMCEFLIVETIGDRFTVPDRGMLGQHAQFDPAVLDVPQLDDAHFAQAEKPSEWHIVGKRAGTTFQVTYPHNPLDVVGWKGDLCVLRLNVDQIRPVVSPRYHLPPSVHTTFVSERVVVCTFCPRPLESDPEAQRVPFFHSNEDYDELVFLHRGNFFSKDHMRAGAMTLHPSGFSHGPAPQAYRAGQQRLRDATDEVGINIDFRDPLEVAELPEKVDLPNYALSWSGYNEGDKR